MANATEPLLAEVFRRLRRGTSLLSVDLVTLKNPALTELQRCAAMAALSIRQDLTTDEAELLRQFEQLFPDVAGVLAEAGSETSPPSGPRAVWLRSFSALRARKPLGRELLQEILNDIVSGRAKDTLTAAWLMTVCVRGMDNVDTQLLTELMASSGDRYDYRESPKLARTRLVRRYPTGALSEKAALILPSLIAAARARVAVCSPFLVARSLGHTGGTWDKLSAIPGFVFPQPGPESIQALVACGVAMTVTHGSANPADRKLYQLRSATGTIESVPLIVSSVASKQLTFPVHRLLLDIRVGGGAFLANEQDGATVGQQVASSVSKAGIDCTYALTPTAQPNGTAIGNALEVAEALAVMGGPRGVWDERGLIEQRLLVIDFFSKLMAAEFPPTDAAAWAHFASTQFEAGSVLSHFAEVLKAHAVPESTLAGLFRDPFSELGIPSDAVSVPSQKRGVLHSVDQFALGEIVNRRLGAGGNDFQGQFDPKAGLILAARLGDLVRAGTPLCRVFAGRPLSENTTDDIA